MQNPSVYKITAIIWLHVDDLVTFEHRLGSMNNNGWRQTSAIRPTLHGQPKWLTSKHGVDFK